MHIFREIAPLQRYLNEHKFQGKKVGFVPTMGALHEGHLSLIRASKEANDITICSIYVNPKQFNNTQDLVKYPRTFERDVAMLEDVGCHAVFCPQDDIIYSNEPLITFSFNGLDDTMEGKFRPGHFSGVALIVSKLFNIVLPDRAYFGQKDLQQYLIIKQLVKDLAFNVSLECVPIVREEDGLAMSSRNKRLSAEGREKAVYLYQALNEVKKQLLNHKTLGESKHAGLELMKERGVDPEYLEIVDPDTLALVENNLSGKNVALCVAGYVDGVRLIDNLIFNLDSES